jgi:predicted RNA-binding Zn-ribbon protein involved in translation (DUF1610 family)
LDDTRLPHDQARSPSEFRALGSVSSAELLLRELYVELRHKLRLWSAVTLQTPQARMGYVGQHLVSVVTGFPGGRSGARGHDLELPGGQYAEIKTCYRVDQLGQCMNCNAAVASIEDHCPRCGETRILRKDDSKWLVGIRNEEEMRTLFEPAWYFLALFDFSVAEEIAETLPETSLEEPTSVISSTPPDINARVWRLDPRHAGFALCMVDYYVNIQARSTSKAPFNLWPYSLKFQLMRPELIYHATISADDQIETIVFEGQRGTIERYPIAPFPAMLGSRRNLGDDKLRRLAMSLGVHLAAGANRRIILEELERHRSAESIDDDRLADLLAELLYRNGIAEYEKWLPGDLRHQ